jgi:NAD(P)-dependent dehydrogenase (short-subunit alcohol dehydrogenase family)
MKDFKGRVAVITGAASGIGRALAKRCARERMKVILADFEPGALAEVEANLQAGGGTIRMEDIVQERNPTPPG